MSYLTETATLEYDTSGSNGNYDYHLPHTKTIDLIGEEFAPKSRSQQANSAQQATQEPSVIVETIDHIISTASADSANSLVTQQPISTMAQQLGPNVVFVNTSGGSGVPLQVQQIIQQAQQQVGQFTVSGGTTSMCPVSVSLPPNTVITTTSSAGHLLQGNSPQTITLSSLPQSTIVTSSGSTLLIQPSHHDQPSPGASLPLTPVTVDLPSIGGSQSTNDEPGVLLCNLDDLSKYIPENFYSEFTMADTGVPDYLQTVVAGKTSTTTVSAGTSGLSTLNGAQQQQPSTIQLPISMAQPVTLSGNSGIQQQPITIQLPTQPQPVQGVKTVTYVNPVISKASPQQVTTVTSSATLQPLRVTQYAYTQSGERIAIQGLDPSTVKPGSQIQFQVKGAQGQTLQLQNIQGLNLDPSKLTVLQELPEVGKVVIQEARCMGDSISSILEEMKTGGSNEETVTLNTGNMEYATAIPVNVTHLASDPKKTTIKRVAAPTSTVFLPGNKTSRNIIFAGNTLPQGAIPIQINGLNAIPLSAVKSLPISISNLSTVSTTPMTTVAAKRTKVEIIPATGGAPKLPVNTTVVTKVTNNNTNLTKTTLSRPVAVPNQANLNRTNTAQGHTGGATGSNNKTCNWVFENGEVCGKTFAKSYNLVVHMRMHEDVRPFGCSFCDQTFRQKAHLQRHETTHGVGVKVNRSSSSSSSQAQRRKRKRSARGGSGNNSTAGTVVTMSTSANMSANLQQRLARVSEQFANKDEEELSINHASGTLKSYSKRKLNPEEDDEDLEDSEDSNGERESKTTVTIQLDPSQQNAVTVTSAGNVVTSNSVFQSSYHVDVQDEVSDLRDEDIIEAVPGTTVVMTSAGSTNPVHPNNVDVVAAAVNEAIKDIEYEANAAAANAASANARSSSDQNNVRVEAQPVDTHANMSPETLTAISGSSSPQPPTIKEDDEDKSEMMQDLFQNDKN